jgi:hypothetical protein
MQHFWLAAAPGLTMLAFALAFAGPPDCLTWRYWRERWWPTPIDLQELAAVTRRAIGNTK